MKKYSEPFIFCGTQGIAVRGHISNIVDSDTHTTEFVRKIYYWALKICRNSRHWRVDRAAAETCSKGSSSNSLPGLPGGDLEHLDFDGSI